MADHGFDGPRPPRPRPLDESRIPAMTREDLLDVVLPAIEHYQRSPRWPRLTPKQQAEYDAWFAIFRRYFRPGDLVGAALVFVRDGDRSYWSALAVPIDREV